MRTGLEKKNWRGGFSYTASTSLSAKQFVINLNVILIHNILSIFVIHYVIKLIYEEN